MDEWQYCKKKDHRFSRQGRTLEADELALHTLNWRAALVVVGRELLICTGTYWKDEETGTTSHFSIGATIVGTSPQITPPLYI